MTSTAPSPISDSVQDYARADFEAAWLAEYPLRSATDFTPCRIYPNEYANKRVSDGWAMWKRAVARQATPSSIPNQAAGELRALPKDVLDALRFYAHGSHYHIDGGHQQFDTVSGEPANWMFSEKDDDCTMFEDGSIARLVLTGRSAGFEEPVEPVEGEVFLAVPTQGADARPVAIYQVRMKGSLKWQDLEQISLSMFDDEEKYVTRIVYATRDAAPSNPWTSAPEALPTKPGNYLAMMADGNSFGYTSDEPVLVEFDAYTDRPGQFTISDSWTNGPETATEEVEFWMPLPARPVKAIESQRSGEGS